MRSEESAVCLVDDDPLVLNSLRYLLASDGIATRSFDNAEPFLAHIKMHMVALVVLDIWMERITGLEVLTRLCVLRGFATNARHCHYRSRRSRGPRCGDAKPPGGLFY